MTLRIEISLISSKVTDYLVLFEGKVLHFLWGFLLLYALFTLEAFVWLSWLAGPGALLLSVQLLPLKHSPVAFEAEQEETFRLAWSL